MSIISGPSFLKTCIFNNFKRNLKQLNNLSKQLHEINNEIELENPNLDGEYKDLLSEYINPSLVGHGVLVLQPYIKWGQNKRRNTTPQLQLDEAKALIETLPRWRVVDSMCISLLSLKKHKLFGKGNLEILKNKIHKNHNITAVFISVNLLRHIQVMELYKIFKVPIYDRYSIVIQIFREHAKTSEAKLQVALAELPYIWKKIDGTVEDTHGQVNISESRRLMLHSRETKLRNALEKLKTHRQLLRNTRKSRIIPIVAVVGYTNAGKTSLIKALTNDESLVPVNKLFATLDTTAHEGLLPCRLKVLYMDTIGFIQDLPEGLMAPFIATFEDAIIADVIIHVYDASHPDREAQIQHVHQTLNDIMTQLEIVNKPIIHCANKCDRLVVGNVPENDLPVSALNLTGIDLLRHKIEKELLTATGRKSIKIRVQSGSTASAWLYKETVVTQADPDPSDPQYLLLTTIVTDVQLHRFRKFLSQ